MGLDEMKTFMATGGKWDQECCKKAVACEKNNSNNATDGGIQEAVDDILSKMNDIISCKKYAIQLRRATGSDAESILGLVNALAAYEKAADEVSVTSSIYQRDGGDVPNPLFHCILIEKIEVGIPSVIGMGFFYFGFSPTFGKYLYLEDLFVQRESRGIGCGKSIMLSLADISIQMGCDSFIWQALSWNTPALKFYDSIGAKVCDGLVTLRLDQERIDKMANEK